MFSAKEARRKMEKYQNQVYSTYGAISSEKKLDCELLDIEQRIIEQIYECSNRIELYGIISKKARKYLEDLGYSVETGENGVSTYTIIEW